MIRDILDYQGNVLGQLELPDDTPEEVWEEKLAPYARPPQDPVEAMVDYLIEKNKNATSGILDQINRLILSNFVSSGLSDAKIAEKMLWAQHRLRALTFTIGGDEYTVDIVNLFVTGDISSALVALSNMPPDDMSLSKHVFSELLISQIVLIVSGRAA